MCTVCEVNGLLPNWIIERHLRIFEFLNWPVFQCCLDVEFRFYWNISFLRITKGTLGCTLFCYGALTEYISVLLSFCLGKSERPHRGLCCCVWMVHSPSHLASGSGETRGWGRVDTVMTRTGLGAHLLVTDLQEISFFYAASFSFLFSFLCNGGGRLTGY